MSNRNKPQNMLRQHLKTQEHFAEKEARKKLPDNEVFKVTTSNHSAALCKECNIKPRAYGSSRCKGCSHSFAKINSKA